LLEIIRLCMVSPENFKTVCKFVKFDHAKGSGKTDGRTAGAAAPLAGHFEVFGPPVTTLLILLSGL